ncbi:MAG: polysaccharide biosynthesis protein [Candidatus Staskawiczbacteria bacterium]|nr:polysaccharide biosynthesis protein [Candidatus Staskawiczbacteria bacterium]
MDLFKRTAVKRMILFISCDVVFIALSIWLAFLIRFDGHISAQYLVLVPRIMVLAIVFIIPVFYFQKLYSFSWSYVSANEVISIFLATTISFIFLSITIFASSYSPRFLNFPRSTIFVSYILVLVFCGGIRFSKRIYSQIVGFGSLAGKDRTLIVGAGDAGEQILRNILSAKKNTYFPIGFIDDNPIKRGVKIHGCTVLGTPVQMPAIIEEYQIRQLIIALPSASNKKIKNVIELARSAGLRKIKIAPQLHEIISGQIPLKNLKDVGVEDLLSRSEIKLDEKEIGHFIKDKVVLVTGAAGSIGSELSRQVSKFKPSLLILLDQDETGIFTIAKELQNSFSVLKIQSLVVDVTDKEKISTLFTEFTPHIVFHAAAYKHVPLMEAQPEEAVKNNIFGAEIMITAALANRVEKFIFISTDKAVNPTSVMGATKRFGEMICQAYNQKGPTKFISVRFGNVLNSRGSVIPIFRQQIKRGGPVEVTHPDMRRYFMLTSEACLLVMQSGAMGQGGEVFVLDMGQPVKILDLAKEMIRLSGFEPDKDIAIVFTGVRPGEKLFEEILTAEEGTAATRNNKIFMAKMAAGDIAGIDRNLVALKSAIQGGGKNTVVGVLKDIIPYYR